MRKRAGTQKGEWNNGLPPFGYRSDKKNKTLAIIEAQAEVVKMVLIGSFKRRGQLGLQVN
ncbi:hypothetical protein KHA80_20075 [Anaerobacillus sp. HL2]|nr:hypothetical protein KHA80_20075 [Anaerobacillus sp. HL2]